jgi:hypothetical protein
MLLARLREILECLWSLKCCNIDIATRSLYSQLTSAGWIHVTVTSTSNMASNSERRGSYVVDGLSRVPQTQQLESQIG